MKKEEFIQKLNTMDAEMEAELREMLDEEMKKPVKKRDAAMIAELTGAITEICGFSTENICNDESISKISGKVTETGRKRKSISVRRISALAACAALLFGLNQASLNAYGENVFSRVYHFTKGGISIMVGEEDGTEPQTPPVTDAVPTAPSAAPTEGEVIELTTAPGDPYGIKAVCAENGFYPMTPAYIPEGYQLTNVDINPVHISFKFTSGDKMIFCNYNFSAHGSLGIAADSNELTETVINGCVFAIVKEDDQFKAMGVKDGVFYSFFTYDESYQEAFKILSSYH